YTDHLGPLRESLQSCGHPRRLERLRDAPRAPRARRGLHRGIGTGCYTESASGAPLEQAIVKVLPDKTVSMTMRTLSSGQATKRALCNCTVAVRCPRSGAPGHRRFRLGHRGGGSHSGPSTELVA